MERYAWPGACVEFTLVVGGELRDEQLKQRKAGQLLGLVRCAKEWQHEDGNETQDAKHVDARARGLEELVRPAYMVASMYKTWVRDTPHSGWAPG